MAWIEEVDRRIIADGKIGPITQRLRDRFRQSVIGRDPETRHWVRPVFESRVNA